MTLILLTFKSRHLKEKVQTSLYCILATDQGFIRGVYLCLCYYYFFRNQIYNYGMVTDHVDTFRHLVQKIAEFLFGDFLWSTMNKKPTTIDFFCFLGTGLFWRCSNEKNVSAGFSMSLSYILSTDSKTVLS